MTETSPETPAEGVTSRSAEPTGSGRFAVYDTTLRRFVGPVVDKRPSKAAANKLVHTADAYEVREV